MNKNYNQSVKEDKDTERFKLELEIKRLITRVGTTCAKDFVDLNTGSRARPWKMTKCIDC